MPYQRVTEKPGGARSVSQYETNIVRAYHPVFRLGSPVPVMFDADTAARLHITVDFFDADAATEFEQKIIAMMPGVE